jgi:hypothetical protein
MTQRGFQQKKIQELIDLIRNKHMVQEATVEAEPEQNTVA